MAPACRSFIIYCEKCGGMDMADFQVTQRVGAKLDYALDWRPWLGGASMISATFTSEHVAGDGGYTLTDFENDGNKTGLTIQGFGAETIFNIVITIEPSSDTDLEPQKVIEVYISS